MSTFYLIPAGVLLFGIGMVVGDALSDKEPWAGLFYGVLILLLAFVFIVGAALAP